MAVDIKILKLLGDQEKRQSKDRQISKDYMENSNRMLESVNESVRYNISQSNSLKSGLGEVTSKLIKEVNTSKKEPQTDTSKSPTVRKLDEIKLILESQNKLLERSINSQFESDPTKITEPTANEEKDKKDKDEDEDNEKETSSLLGGLLTKLAGPALAVFGAGLVGALSPLIEPISRLITGITGLRAIFDTLTGLIRKIPGVGKLLPKPKTTKTTKTGDGKKTSKSKQPSTKQPPKNAKGLSKTTSDASKSAKSPKKPGKIASTAKGALKPIAKGAKFAARGLPLLSLGLEVADGYNMYSMESEEREKYLDNITEEMKGKSKLERAWYAYNNQAKVLAAGSKEVSEWLDAKEGIKEGEALTDELQEKLRQAELRRAERDRLQAEKLKAVPIIEQPDKELLKEFEKLNKRFEDPEFMRTLPVMPSNTTVNNTTVTVPGSDYGNTIRKGNR